MRCPRNDTAVDLNGDPWVGAGTAAGEGAIEGEQVTAGLLDDDILLAITLVGVGGVVDDVEAGPVTGQGEGGLVVRVQVFA